VFLPGCDENENADRQAKGILGWLPYER
jgi:hypothetical protein